MELIPTNEEVVNLLRETGALKDGHFEYANGLHSNEYLQVPLAMRYYQHSRTLSVGVEPAVTVEPRDSRLDCEAVDCRAGDGRTASRLRRVRGVARASGLLGRAR